jgi:hypothetical protein
MNSREETVMSKAFVVLGLVLAFSTQPALAGKTGVGRETAVAPKSKVKVEPRFGRSAVTHAGPAECKKYFPLIGSLVSVPCTP